MTCAKPLADGVREREEKIATAAWKKAYLKTAIGTNGPPGKLRGVLLTLWDLSDPMGRTWHSLHSISQQSKTKKRTLQRLLDDLEENGWITKTPMTWAQLAIEQANLGFPLPARHDDANAPVLILLTYKGKPAMDEMRLRVATDSQFGHDPRTKRSQAPMDKLAHDPEISVLAVNKQEVGDPKASQPPPAFLNNQLEPAELEGWGALLHSYDLHYKRVYKARPTSEVPMWLAKPLGGHIADLAVLLRARLQTRNVTISLEEAIGRIADKAMGTWLDSKGSDGSFLRKVAHRMSELQNDLPRQARQAVDAILGELSPKPEPRTANVVPFTPRTVVVKPNLELHPIIEVPNTNPPIGREELHGSVKPNDSTDAPEENILAVSARNSAERQTVGKLDQVKPSNCTNAPERDVPANSSQISAGRQAIGELAQEKPNDCTDAPGWSVPAVSARNSIGRQTVGKLDQEKPKDCVDAPGPNAPASSPQILVPRQTTGKLAQVKRSDRTDAPQERVIEARKLLDRLGKPTWCDETLAVEMLHARSADVVLSTISKLCIDEKSMTKPQIYAMIFIALYGPRSGVSQ